MSCESGGHDEPGGADQRSHLLWPVPLGSGREASHKTRLTRRVGRAHARCLGRADVASQRGRQQEGASGARLARCHRRRGQPEVPRCRPAQGARRWEGRRTIHRDRGRARLLLLGAGRADERAGREAGIGGRLSLHQPACPPHRDGRARRRRPQAVEAAERRTLRHDRRCWRRRQDHGRNRGRASPSRGFRGRRALRRPGHAERSRLGSHGRGIHAGALRSSRRRDAHLDRLPAGQANPPDL